MRLFWSVVLLCVLCVFVISAAAYSNTAKNSLSLISASANKTEENKMERGNIIPYKHKWVTVTLDAENGVMRDVDTASILFSSYNKFVFLHRIVLKSPIEMSNVRFQFVLAISTGDCSTWTTRNISDVEYLGTQQVAKDLFVDPADIKAPKDSFNDQILSHACKMRDRMLI